MGRIASAALLFLLLPATALAQHVICDVTCEPDPTSTTYPPTVPARPATSNARGSSSSVVPMIARSGPTGGSGGQPAILPGSESYNYAIPILSLPGRNGLDLNLTLYYNSRVWTIDTANATATFNADRDVPSYGFRLGFGYLEYDSTNNAYILTESDGTKRHFAFTTTNSYDSDDASYINYNSSAKVLKYKNGTQVLYAGFPSASTKLFRPTQITDTNGNFITIAYVPHVSGKDDDQRISTITDTLGQVITFNYDANSLLSTITQGAKTYGTFSWNTSYILRYNFAGLTVDANSPANNSTLKVLSGCTYPNGVSYSFIYGDWGIVKEIDRKSSNGTLRSSVSYNYPTAAAPLSSHPTWTTETFYDGVNTLNTTSSTVKAGNLVSTYTVTDPGGTKTVATLDTSDGAFTGLMSSREIQNGTGGGSVPLRHIDYTWTSDASGANPRLASAITTLSDTGQQSEVVYTYTTSYGNVSLVQEYDYGLVLKRQTALTYLTTSSYTVTYHILDRPTQVLVKDGAGAIVARTNVTYDGSSLTSVTSAAHHNDTSYSASFLTRGNVTSITRYSNAAAGTGAIARNFAYDSLGNLRTADLDCCNTKQWSYSSTTQWAYPDSVTRGPVGTQLTTSATYNFASGTVATSTDENGKVTQFTYDAMDRPATVTPPNGVQVTASYGDSVQLATVSLSSTANSAVQQTTVDGRGRTLQQQLLNGLSSVSAVITSYNDVARQVITSNPAGPTDPLVTTTTQLDNLGRTVSVTPPSGGIYQSAYAGNVVTITDPAGKQRRNTTDALGRLVKVEEPGWGDGLPGKGSVTISGGEQVIPKRCHIDPDTGLLFCDPAVYDSGTVSITVNGVTKTVGYGGGSTSLTVASALASAINGDTSYPVSASVSSSTVSLTSKVANASTNYTLSAASQTSNPGTFGGPSFAGTPSGPTLTGAMNPSGPDAPSLNSPITTTYSYDTLNNLTLVSQEQGWPLNGQPLPAQTRTYVYDSLSRVTSAATPESGTVSYTYTSFSQVATRTDARGIISTYGYDGLNRLTGVTYSDGTPAVTYTYDAGGAAANALGRLTSLADGGGSESYTYDLMGRITQVSKVISGTTYNVGYGYNGAGQLNSLTYPSGRVVAQSYDAIGWLSSIGSGATNYLSNPSFNAAGQPLGFSYGNGVNATFSYNDHLQVASIRYSNATSDLLNLAYGYGTQNNGQIQGITDNLDATRSASYSYDAWARLKTATAGPSATPTWSLSYDYDRFGNRRNQNVIGGTGPAVSLTIDPNTNRIQDAGYAYDSSGNLTNDTFHSYAYDAENRTKTVDSTGATYTYSGALRVKKVVGATTTVYVFSGSKVIAEYANGAPVNQPSKEYVYAGSQLLATISGVTTIYSHSDHLSIRAQTDTTGALLRSYGHFPFGEMSYENLSNGGATDKWDFTSYERDSESGLDQAIFRYDSSRLGRFMSPDPLGGSIFDPQSLNRYAYVNNDPTNLIDPLGLTAPQVKPYDPYADSGWTSLTLLELLSTIASTPTGYGPVQWNLDNEGRWLPTNTYVYGNTWVLGLIGTQGVQPGTYTGGGGGNLGASVKPALLLTVLGNSECAALFGGAGQAALLIVGTNITNLDIKTTGRTGQEQAIVNYHNSTGSPIASVIGGNTIGVFNNFYSIYPDFGQQIALFFHELEHVQGMPQDTNVQQAVEHAADVGRKCPLTEVETIPSVLGPIQ